MRFMKCCAPGLLTALLLAGGPMRPSRLAAADEPKSETPPAPVKEVLDKYLKAAAAKDVVAMTALAGVPWLDRDRKLVRDRTDLGKAVERVAAQLPKDEGMRKVETFPYKKMRERLKDEAERKLLDGVLGADGWLVLVEEDGYPLSMRTVLIRVTDGKAAVVGGPLKENQITQRNRIPDVVLKLFAKADSFELYSLDPERKPGAQEKPVEGKDGFHGWKVLGKIALNDEARRKKLADALRQGAEDNFGMVAGCFIPRHGLRLKGEGKTVDLVICFQCLQVNVFVDGKQDKGFLTTGEPQKEFDAALRVAGIALPKPAPK
jgi:hypothetical protein